MKIARLNSYIVIEKMTVETDEIGNHKENYKKFYCCFAKADTYLKQETGNEVISDNESICFEIRYCSILDELNSTRYRVNFNNRIYNIEAVDFMNYGHKTIKLKCRKEKYHVH